MGIVLENIRVSFVNVITPKPNLSGADCYSLCALIDKDDEANMKRVRDAEKKAIAKGKSTLWGGKLPKFRYNPVRDGDAEIESGDREGDEYINHVFINPTMLAARGKPGTVDENLQPVMEEGKFYSGCYCHVEVSAYPFKKSGNSGVGWGLENIMFVSDGDRLDGRRSAESAFKSLAPQNPEDAQTDFD